MMNGYRVTAVILGATLLIAACGAEASRKEPGVEVQPCLGITGVAGEDLLLHSVYLS